VRSGGLTRHRYAGRPSLSLRDKEGEENFYVNFAAR